MKAERFIALVVLQIFWITSAQAGVIPGRWEKVDGLADQSPVIVTLKQGERIEGRINAKTPESITLLVDRRGELILQKQAIRTVTSLEKRPDSTRNGALIGAGIGFGIGFGALLAAEKSTTLRIGGLEIGEENDLGAAVLGGLAGSAIGAVAGWAIDKKQTAEEVLYRAP